MNNTPFKKWCMEQGYSIKKAAEIAEIPKRTIESYWQGKRSPTRAREKELIQRLGIPKGLFD